MPRITKGMIAAAYSNLEAIREIGESARADRQHVAALKHQCVSAGNAMETLTAAGQALPAWIVKDRRFLESACAWRVPYQENPRRRRARRRSTSSRTLVDRNPRKLDRDIVAAFEAGKNDLAGNKNPHLFSSDLWEAYAMGSRLALQGATLFHKSRSKFDTSAGKFAILYRKRGDYSVVQQNPKRRRARRRPSALAEVKAFQKRERQKHKAGRVPTQWLKQASARAKRNPIRKRYVVELLHKNYGLWYLKRADRPGKNTTQRREAAEVFETEKAAGVAMRAAHDAFPARVRRDFVWMRTAVK